MYTIYSQLRNFGHPTQIEIVVKILLNFGYKVDVLRDNGLRFTRSKQCYPTNNIMIQKHSKLTLF